MRPALSSTRQAGAFALLLLVILLLPVIFGKSCLPPRSELYSCDGWDLTGPHPYVYNQIFEEKGDIDIAFVGSSKLMYGIDALYVQQKLSEKLGRKAVVRSICWGGSGYDALYFRLQDLLAHRKVRMLVIYDETHYYDHANFRSPRWFRYGDNNEALAGLPFKMKAIYYYAAVLGMPRNLLSMLRLNLPADLTDSKMRDVEKLYHCPVLPTKLGSICSEAGYNSNNGVPSFIPYKPQNGVTPFDTCIYSPESSAKFDFSGPSVPEWQLHFARKAGALIREHGIKLILVNIPQVADIRSPAIREREYWPDKLQTDLTMIGIPPARMFAGISDEDAYKLYFDFAHFNGNGQKYFTDLLTPSLLKTYDAQAKD